MIPGYTELSVLGEGGFGEVVLARHDATGTYVAIKYLTDTSGIDQFRAEARLLHHVRDDHVARFFELVEGPAGAAIVMEAVDGASLRALLDRQGAPGPEAALVILKGSLLGLAAAHSAGVVHRDYKPANVLVQGDGQSKLVDFGIAALAGEHAIRAGTPAYMAPEQWRGDPPSPATDVYAATCVFLECVTGARPYEGDSDSLRLSHERAPIPIERVPVELRPIVFAGLAKDPAHRPGGAAAFVAMLEETAQRAYGTKWERTGLCRLAEAAAGLAALFPLVALAGGKGAGAVGAGHSAGLLSKVATTKVAVAAAGTAVVASAAVTVVVVTTPRHHAAAVVHHTPTKTMAFNGFTLGTPVSWTLGRDGSGDLNFGSLVTVPGKCVRGTPPSTVRSCPGFHVLNRYWITGMNHSGPIAPFNIRASYAGQNQQDEGGYCPPSPDLRADDALMEVAGSVERTAKLTASAAAPVGTRTAQYREWRIPCFARNTAQDGAPIGKPKLVYTERIWYIKDADVLIVDDWQTPNLAEILRQAAWK